MVSTYIRGNFMQKQMRFLQPDLKKCTVFKAAYFKGSVHFGKEFVHPVFLVDFNDEALSVASKL